MANNGAFVFGGSGDSVNSIKGASPVAPEDGFEIVSDNGHEPVVPTSPALPDSILIGVEDVAKTQDIAPDVWEVFSGTTLETVLMEWGDRAGWTVVWQSDYSYPISAAAEFKGSFVDVSAKLIRTMSKATPPVRGRYFKGNNVLVVETILDGQS